MPDRYIRDELLESERWLAVDNLAKLAFLACMLRCDSVGNMDAQPLRLYRLWRDFGAGTVEASEEVLGALVAVDLVRTYCPVDNRRFIHIPRFGQSRMYLGRLHPPSPWDGEKRDTQRTKNQTVSGKTQGVIGELSEITPGALSENSTGVGVGVGVGLERGGVSSADSRPQASCQPPAKPVYKKSEKVKPEPPAVEPSTPLDFAERLAQALKVGPPAAGGEVHRNRHAQLAYVAAQLQQNGGDHAARQGSVEEDHRPQHPHRDPLR